MQGLIADLQPVRLRETGLFVDSLAGRNPFDDLQHAADEAVAHALYTLHDRRAIDPGRLDMDTELPCPLNRMGRLGGRDQQLARHAAIAGTGGAIGTALDQYEVIAVAARDCMGGEASGAGPDDGDFDMAFHSAELICLRLAAAQRA